MELRASPPLGGSPEQLFWLFPAGPPFKGIDLAAPDTRGLSREVTSNFRSAAIELLSHASEVQNAHCQVGRVSDQVRGLVCHDRSKRRLFPSLHPSQSQEVPEVCFQGQSLPISGSSLRPSTLTPNFHEVCGCCSGSSATPGHPHTQLHKRLVDFSSFRADGGLTSRCRSRSAKRVGVKTKCQEKCAVSITEDHLFRRGLGFDHDAGTFVSCSDQVDSHYIQESQRRPVTHCQAVSKTAGSDGSFVQRDTFLPAVHETPTVVAQDQGVLPEGKTALHDQALTLATDASLTGWGVFMSGRPARSLWSGRHFTWHINCLEMLAMFRALKHFLPDLRNHHVLVRTDNTAVVSYINHQGGLRSRPLYKLAHQILVWSQDKFLLLSAIYIPGHLNIGADILSRQEPRPGGMEASPQDGEAYLKSFWPDTGGSVCDSSDIALSPLVLSDSYSSTGAGCYGTEVAEASSVCLLP